MKNPRPTPQAPQKQPPHRVTLWRHRKAIDPSPLPVGRPQEVPDATWKRVLRKYLKARLISPDDRRKIAKKTNVDPRTVDRAFKRLLPEMSPCDGMPKPEA